MARTHGGKALVVATAAVLAWAQIVAGVPVTPLSLPSHGAAATYTVENESDLRYEDWALVVNSSDLVTAVEVTLNNTDGSNSTSGEIEFVLVNASTGTVSGGNQTFFVQKGEAGLCHVDANRSVSPTEFSQVLLVVNATGDVAKSNADCSIQGGQTGTNDPPRARLETSPNKPDPGETVTFSANKSDDKDGTIVAFRWEIEVENGSTITPTGEVVTHTYNETGCFNASVTVEDNDGATDTANTTVEVDSPGQPNVQC